MQAYDIMDSGKTCIFVLKLIALYLQNWIPALLLTSSGHTVLFMYNFLRCNCSIVFLSTQTYFFSWKNYIVKEQLETKEEE